MITTGRVLSTRRTCADTLIGAQGIPAGETPDRDIPCLAIHAVRGFCTLLTARNNLIPTVLKMVRTVHINVMRSNDTLS